MREIPVNTGGWVILVKEKGKTINGQLAPGNDIRYCLTL